MRPVISGRVRPAIVGGASDEGVLEGHVRANGRHVREALAFKVAEEEGLVLQGGSAAWVGR